ncbi:MmyB family transcriptional regulator [Nocardia amikacinitolerans]|uniref:MmyB family transcriptional regulator n=1 Tax=Nocardia amikacinitolerans TaxID=756689 RepID=UPI0020A37FC1|nr:hypothetical protein [Nocardia amikacinitolerans]
MLVDHRYDILAWNREMACPITDFEALPERWRNSMLLCLLDPALREFFAERERVIREGVADLRAAWVAHPEDQRLADSIGEFTAHSEEFARAWDRHDVKVQGRGNKPLCHPEVGPLVVTYEVLMPLQDPDQRIIIYRAADADSQVALNRLRPASRQGSRARRNWARRAEPVETKRTRAASVADERSVRRAEQQLFVVLVRLLESAFPFVVHGNVVFPGHDPLQRVTTIVVGDHDVLDLQAEPEHLGGADDLRQVLASDHGLIRVHGYHARNRSPRHRHLGYGPVNSSTKLGFEADTTKAAVVVEAAAAGVRRIGPGYREPANQPSLL